MAKLALTNLVNLQNENTAVSAINANNASLIAAMEKTLSRDGTLPNQMGDTLDMNSKQIINLPSPITNTSPLRVGDLTVGGLAVNISPLPVGGNTGEVLVKLSNTNYNVGWSTSSSLVTNFATIAAVQAATILATTAAILVAGYAALGDAPPAVYVRRGASQPTHTAKIQSADGAWWELETDRPNGLHFGMVGDGVTDNYTQLTNLLAFAVYKKTDAYVPGGSYVINMSGVRTSILLQDVQLLGDGRQFYWPSATALYGTWFFIKGVSASPFLLGGVAPAKVGGRSALKNINFLWPDQLNLAAPIVYPAAILTINGSSIIEVADCCFTNAYTAIYLSDATGGNGDVEISGCYFSCMDKCIHVSATSFQNWTHHNEFHWSAGYNFYNTGNVLNPAYPSGQGNAWIAYVQAHCIGMQYSASHADGQIISDNLFGGVLNGIYCSENASEQAFWATISNNIFDGCTIGLKFENKFRPYPVSVSNCHFQGVPLNAASKGIEVALNGAAQWSLAISNCQFGAEGNSHLTAGGLSGQPGDLFISNTQFIMPANNQPCIFISGDAIDLSLHGNIFDGGGSTTPKGVEFSIGRNLIVIGNLFKNLLTGVFTDTTVNKATIVGNISHGVTTSEIVGATTLKSGFNSWSP